MAYLFAHIKLRPGKVQQFTEVLGQLAPLLEKHGGWKLHGSYFNVIGRLHTVVDVWKRPHRIPSSRNGRRRLRNASRMKPCR